MTLFYICRDPVPGMFDQAVRFATDHGGWTKFINKAKAFKTFDEAMLRALEKGDRVFGISTPHPLVEEVTLL